MSEMKHLYEENVIVFQTLLNNAFELEMKIAQQRITQIRTMNKVLSMFDEYQGFINYCPDEHKDFMLNWRQYLSDNNIQDVT
tara:strand:- start:3075 stop:3320 length:246 start_codon:yes stop_codon:yes gene_type:complete